MANVITPADFIHLAGSVCHGFLAIDKNGDVWWGSHPENPRLTREGFIDYADITSVVWKQITSTFE